MVSATTDSFFSPTCPQVGNAAVRTVHPRSADGNAHQRLRRLLRSGRLGCGKLKQMDFGGAALVDSIDKLSSVGVG